MITVIAYDIPDNSRRTKISKVLENYGFRVQFSIFEVYLDRKEVNKLRKELDKIIDLEEDKIKIYMLNESNSITIGKDSSIINLCPEYIV